MADCVALGAKRSIFSCIGLLIAALAVCISAVPSVSLAKSRKPATPKTQKAVLDGNDDRASEGTVTVEGRLIGYRAVAGLLTVDALKPGQEDEDAEAADQEKSKSKDKDHDAEPGPAKAAMFYVAYFKGGARNENGTAKADERRPVTFFFNGGPGSSTVWLHMGAFGPRRVVTQDDSHTAPAPYPLVDNAYSLLNASDLVFIDAPGTGFGHISGKDAKKSFYSVDGDAHAFSNFIVQFLTRYGRWNSPKFLFGESYGTTRAAVVANLLATEQNVDLNGVILLSQILNFDTSDDAPSTSPGIDEPYYLALPTYAATAWYHHKLPSQPAELEPFLADVERFATTDYASALRVGNRLDDASRQSIAERLHDYTGLPVSYLMKADLRIDGGVFQKQLQDDAGLTTGRLDTRFSGPDLDRLSKESEYDPQSAAISSAYVSTFNDYVRKTLKFGETMAYLPEGDFGNDWNLQHRQPGSETPSQSTTNVMPDLAVAMKLNPQLKVMMNGGYYDLATPFFAAVYELDHLPIPATLQGNIETHFYQSGHMVYAHQEALKELHDNVSTFIHGAVHGRD